jgi:hypothetical protein
MVSWRYRKQGKNEIGGTDYSENIERFIQVRTGRKMNRQTDSETVMANKTERLMDKRKKRVTF